MSQIHTAGAAEEGCLLACIAQLVDPLERRTSVAELPNIYLDGSSFLPVRFATTMVEGGVE